MLFIEFIVFGVVLYLEWWFVDILLIEYYWLRGRLANSL